MSRPKPSAPEDRAAAQAELRKVGVAWRVAGIAVVLAAVLWMLIASGLGHDLDDAVFQASLVLLAAGWCLVAVGAIKRSRRRRATTNE